MSPALHPSLALLQNEQQLPAIAVCEHFAGSEKLILKSFELQEKLGPVFDITCDCEDGAAAGQEIQHAEMIVRIQNSSANRYKMAGVRVHDHSHPAWKQEINTLVDGLGETIAYITLPKCSGVKQAREMIEYIQQRAAKNSIKRVIPIHVLIETHGALREVHQIAALPWVQTLDFGLLDFISAHHGAIPASAMRSPGQFEHKLLMRAKSEIVAAALAHGVVPAHNITLDLNNPDSAYHDARRARLEYGFLRQWSIHPSQIQAIVNAMQPDYAEVETASAILLAAQLANWGPIQHNGELHDRASYRYYWELLEKARISGVKLPMRAESAFFHHPIIL